MSYMLMACQVPLKGYGDNQSVPDSVGNMNNELKAKEEWLSYHFVEQHVKWKLLEPVHIKEK